MPPRRDGILGFDRLHGIQIADLADRLMEAWPTDRPGDVDIVQARAHVDALQRCADELATIAVDLRAALERIEREAATDAG